MFAPMDVVKIADVNSVTDGIAGMTGLVTFVNPFGMVWVALPVGERDAGPFNPTELEKV